MLDRDKYVVGSIAKGLSKAGKKAIESKRKYKARRSREQIDADNAKILEQKKAKKEAKEEAKLKQEKLRGTWRFKGDFFDGAGKEYLLKKEEPEGTGAFRAAYRYAWQNKKDTFTHKGEEYSTDLSKGNTQKSLLVSQEREKKGLGGKIISEVADFMAVKLAKEAPEVAKKLKDKTIKGEEQQRIIMQEVESNPYMLDELSDDQFNKVLEVLPAKSRAKLGAADDFESEMMEYNTAAIEGMTPEDVAENLQYFDDIDDIEDYMNSLSAKDLRKFTDSLSEDDYAAFEDFIPELGPRIKKAEGSMLGGEGKAKEAEKAIIINKVTDAQDPTSKSQQDSIMFLKGADKSTVMQAIQQTVSPQDQKEMRQIIFGRTKRAEGSMLVAPEDTYTPEEQANAAESQLPDEQMEEKYMDFVLDESLDTTEQEYLIGALESDPKLSEIFDKVVTTASEFSGAGEVKGPGTGVSDSIPARLSDGEFVITRKATDQIGADNLQMMMDDAERMADGGEARGGFQLGGLLGMPKDPEEELEAMGQLRSTDDEVNKSMLMSNQVPSLRR